MRKTDDSGRLRSRCCDRKLYCLHGIQKTDRDDLILIEQKLAHALLFQGHYDDALAIYRKNWDKPLHGKTFGEITLEDFAAFDKAGLNHPDLSRMKQALGDLDLKEA